MNFLKSVCIFCVLVANFMHPVVGSEAEKRLLKKLLDCLNPLERPVVNDNETVTVKFGLSLMRLVNVDVEKHHIQLTLWENIEWNTNCIWDPREFNNISDVRIPTDRMWIPDIYAYNQVGENFDPYHKTKVVLKNAGNASYIPPGQATTSCSINVKKYPFEEVSCDLKFGSWVHDGFQMDLEMSDEGGDMSSLVENPEWEILGFPGKRNAVFYTCCPEPYIDVTFSLKLQRRGNAILSSARTMLLVIITILFMSTLLVSSSAFKLFFPLCSLFLSANSVTVYNPCPGKAEPPELAMYFSHLVFVSLSVLLTNMVVYNLFHKLGAAPDLVKKILEKSPIARPRSDPEVSSERRDTLTPHEQNYNDLQELTSRSYQRDHHSASTTGVSDWKYLSIVLDKFFFLFWMVFIVIFHLAAFPSF